MTNSTAIGPPGPVFDFSSPGASAGSANALIAVLVDSDVALSVAQANLPQWRRANPQADWIGVDIKQVSGRSERNWLLRTLSDQLAIRQMQEPQLVVLGRRQAGRLAIDLLLEGALCCAGIIGVDISCAPPQRRIRPTLTSIRLVLHGSIADRGKVSGLTEVLRHAEIDTRCMMLPSIEHSFEETAHAVGTFMVELVAKACWHSVFNQPRRARHD
jgi:hypothetical protein